MKNDAMGFGDIPLAGDTLQLAPGLATEMAIGAEVATTEPAAIVATVMRAKVHVGIDGAPAGPG